MTDYNHSSKFKEIKEKIDSSESIKDVETIKSKLQKIEQDEEVSELISICEKREDEIRLLIKEQNYQEAVAELKEQNVNYDSVIEKLKNLNGYKDSAEIVNQLITERLYSGYLSQLKTDNPDWENLLSGFERLGDYKDSEKYFKQCQQEVDRIKKEKKIKDEAEKLKIYKETIAEMSSEKPDWDKLMGKFAQLGDFKDSKKKYALCEEKVEQARKKEQVIAAKKKKKKIVKVILIISIIIGIPMIINFSFWCKDDNAHWRVLGTHSESHKSIVIETKESTCTEQGYVVRKCKVCGYEWKNILDIAEHTFDNGTVVKEPTCTEEGKRTYHCIVCGEVARVDDIPTIAHSMDDGVISKEPTCTEMGEVVYTCNVCGYHETKKIQLKEHEYKLVENVNPKCTVDGYVLYECVHCHVEKKERKPFTGHSFVGDYCTVCGVVDYKKYSVGSKGQAGGYVFYDCDADNNSGNKDGLISSECGWRFLEVSPYDVGDGEVEFCTKSFISYNGTEKLGDSIGRGKKNTEILLSGTDKKGKRAYAAELCRNFSYNGYDDWFLPSFEELLKIKRNLGSRNIGNFMDKSYWSSSRNMAWSSDGIVVVRFGDSNNYGDTVHCYTTTSLVRAVRAF